MSPSSPPLVAILHQAGLSQLEYTLEAPLLERSWFKVGGAAQVLVHTAQLDKVQSLIQLAHLHQIDLFFLGDASNLVISDQGIAGIVIDTQALAVEQKPSIYHEGNQTFVVASAGMLMEQLVLWCINQQLIGLEHFYGLPGTLGGALYMNARCYEGEIADVVTSISVLDSTGAQQLLPMVSSEWDYKLSPLQGKPYLAYGATLRLSPSPKSVDELRAKAFSYKEDRTQKGHFAHPCAGSTFKNNRTFGKPSGQIIDECQLKGLQVGGACISPFHANIIINHGSASALDIYQLVQLTQQKVTLQTGFTLEPEVLFVGRNFPL
jgi:UDP-N-acetylmuramate dehydrogenase